MKNARLLAFKFEFTTRFAESLCNIFRSCFSGYVDSSMCELCNNFGYLMYVFRNVGMSTSLGCARFGSFLSPYVIFLVSIRRVYSLN